MLGATQSIGEFNGVVVVLRSSRVVSTRSRTRPVAIDRTTVRPEIERNIEICSVNFNYHKAHGQPQRSSSIVSGSLQRPETMERPPLHMESGPVASCPGNSESARFRKENVHGWKLRSCRSLALVSVVQLSDPDCPLTAAAAAQSLAPLASSSSSPPRPRFHCDIITSIVPAVPAPVPSEQSNGSGRPQHILCHTKQVFK